MENIPSQGLVLSVLQILRSLYAERGMIKKFIFKISLEVKLHFITTMFHYNSGWLVHD